MGAAAGGLSSWLVVVVDRSPELSCCGVDYSKTWPGWLCSPLCCRSTHWRITNKRIGMNGSFQHTTAFDNALQIGSMAAVALTKTHST